MSTKSDGRVIIDTEMNTKPLEASIDDIKAKLSGVSGAFSEFGGLLRRTFNKVRFASQITAEVEKGREKIRALTDQIVKVRQEEKAFLRDGGQESSGRYQKMEQELASLREQANDTRQYLAEVKRGQVSMGESMGSMSYFSPLISRIKSGLKGIAQSAVKGAVSLAKMAGRGIINGFKKLGSALKNVFSHLHKTNHTGFGGGFKNILKYAFGIRSLFVLFNRLRRALVDGFTTLAKFDGETNTSISNIKNSLEQLKNSVASAFAPLFNAIAPILDAIIQKITLAMTALAQFMSAMTGKKTFMKATKGSTDFAKSLDNTAESAKKAKTYLSGLDEVATFTSNDDDSASGAGAGTSGGFEEAEVESRFSQLADKIKGFFKSEDWDGLGAWMASGINTAVDGIYNAVSWERVGPQITKFVNGFTTTFNSLVTNINWENIGATLGAGLNTIVNTLDLFYTGIDWRNLGSSLGDIIDGWVQETDWVAIGGLVQHKIEALLDLVSGFFEDTDWFALGQSLMTAVESVDWGTLSSKLFEGIGSILGGLSAFILGLIKDAWDSVVSWWYETAYEDGEFTMEGLLKGIWEKIKDIGKWIYDHIFKPFVDGFKKAFGIASPSKVLYELGDFLMQGLYNGINSLVSKVVGIFTNIKNGIVNIWNALKTATTNTWNGIMNAIRSPINSIIGFINRMISGVVGGINSMTSALNMLHIDLPDWIGGGSIGFNIPRISTPQIPYLASGAVIPPNAPFLAMLGDQRQGTNVEAPLETIKQAVAEVVGGNMKGGEYVFTAQINRRTLFEEVIEEARIKQSATGRNPFDLARA